MPRRLRCLGRNGRCGGVSGAGGNPAHSWSRGHLCGKIAIFGDVVTSPDLLALSYAGNMGLVSRKFPMRMLHALGATETDGTICDSTSTAGYAMVLGDVIGADIEQADLLVLPVRLTEDVPRGLLRVDGFPREDALAEGVGVNALTSPATSDLGGGNVLYSTRVGAALAAPAS